MRKEAVLALTGLALLGGGVFWWRSGGVEQDKIEIIEDTVLQKIKLDVEGAVEKPGIYEVGSGTRVGEVLGLAGLSSDADTKWIEKYLNRAEVVKDGMKIYIPYKNTETLNSKFQINTKIQNTKIDLNTAGQEELEELPGVGPVTAGKIINGRPYGRVEELLERKVVGQKVWEQIKESISVW